MKNSEPTLEHAFYAFSFLLAIGLRFLHLGNLPLSDYEARWALDALQVAQGVRPAIGSNPAYVHLTAALFFVFGSSNFLARFWPALAGCLLTIAPWLLRRRLGRITALVLSFGLAIDPGLVVVSHLAGGPMIAITCLVLMGLFWLEGWSIAAGIFAGLALLSGSSIWFALLVITISGGLFVVIKIHSIPVRKITVSQNGETSNQINLQLQDLQPAFYWGLGTLVLVGSLFLFSPKGLPAFVMSLVKFIQGWWLHSGVQVWRLLLALPAYEILPLTFGIAGVLRGIFKWDATSIRLGIWFFLAFIMLLIYPGRQTDWLTWALLPLWTLAAIELSHHFDFRSKSGWELAGAMTLIVSLLVFGWLDLAGITTMDIGTEEAHMRFYLLLAVVLLVVLSLLLVGAGWSSSLARLAGVWSAVLVLSIFTVSMSTGAAGLRQPLTVELWQPEPRPERLDVLLKVANQISDLNAGYTNELPLTIVGLQSPALHWLFRDWKVTDVVALTPDMMPEMVVTSSDQLALSADYRGEPLPLSEIADWSHATTSLWLKWYVYRQMPILREDIILWVRSDLMLDNQDQSTN